MSSVVVKPWSSGAAAVSVPRSNAMRSRRPSRSGLSPLSTMKYIALVRLSQVQALDSPVTGSTTSTVVSIDVASSAYSSSMWLLNSMSARLRVVHEGAHRAGAHVVRLAVAHDREPDYPRRVGGVAVHRSDDHDGRLGGVHVVGVHPLVAGVRVQAHPVAWQPVDLAAQGGVQRHLVELVHVVGLLSWLGGWVVAQVP